MSLNDDIGVKSLYDHIVGALRENVLGNWANLGPVVRDARIRANLTQQDLASRAGVSRGWLVRFESGLPNAEPVSVVRLLRELDLQLVVRPRDTASLGVDAPPGDEVDLDMLIDGDQGLLG